MKISKPTFRYLFKAATQDKESIIRNIFKGQFPEFSEEEFILVERVHQELTNIAKSFVEEFDLLYDIGESVDIYLGGYSPTRMSIRMSGDQAPWADEDDDPDDYGFDIIGEWTINIKTGETDFEAEKET